MKFSIDDHKPTKCVQHNLFSRILIDWHSLRNSLLQVKPLTRDIIQLCILIMYMYVTIYITTEVICHTYCSIT